MADNGQDGQELKWMTPKTMQCKEQQNILPKNVAGEKFAFNFKPK